MNVPPYISALERNDLKRYPSEISNVPHRGAPATAPEVDSFADVAAQVASDASAQPASAPQTAGAKPAKPFALWQNGAFGFGDFIDIINPLQHIPVVATIYRNMSGDQIGAAPRIIGGALWGRLGGFVSGVVNAVVDWFTGKDIGDHIYAALFGKGDDSAPSPVVAQPAKPEKIRVEKAAAHEAIPQNSFADEAHYSHLLGRYTDDPPAETPQVAQSQAPAAPLGISAVNSYSQNIPGAEASADSKFRFFA